MKKSIRILICLATVLVMALCVFTACNKTGAVESYVLSFDVDGEQYHTVATMGNETITVPSAPIKIGFEFDGWYLDKNVWARPFTADTFKTEALQGNTTVYAKWKKECAHIIVADKGYASTCTTDGLTDGSHCSICNKVTQEQKVIPALQHSTKQVAAKAPTCTEVGWNAYEYCTRCDYTTMVEIEANGHTESEWIVDVEAACLTKGHRHTICEVCHVTLKDEATNALDHDVQQGEAKEASCTEVGWAAYEYCSRCDYSTKVETEATGHHFSAEFEHDETQHWLVADCGHEVTKDTAKHTFDSDWKCTVCEYLDEGLHGTEVAVQTLAKEGKNLSIAVSNRTDRFSFIGEISVAKGATYSVHTDIGCTETSKLNSKTTMLEIGDNELYILVENGEEIDLYTVVIRRRPMYTVTFDTKGGTAIESKVVEENTLLSELPTTARKGYTFKAWDYDFNNAIVKDTTATASWEAIKYKITFDYKIANNSLSKVVENKNPTTYTIEDAITLTAPTRKGYTFAGWDKASIAKGTTGNVKVTASWTLNEYTIEYTNNGGTVDGTNATKYTIEDDFELIPATLEGKLFCGWYDEKGNFFAKIAAGEARNLKLSASFDATAGLVLGNNASGEFGVIGYDEAATAQSVSIPKTYMGKAVTFIADSVFTGHSEITAVTIPDSITSIGDYAFQDCAGLQNVVIPDSVTTLGTAAFSGCAELLSVTLSNKMTVIGAVAFSDCAKLQTVNMSKSIVSIEDFAFLGCEQLTTINFDGSESDWEAIEKVEGWNTGCENVEVKFISDNQ